MLDETDMKILDKLRYDAQKSVASIARDLGMPRPTVHYRIERMREEGFIRGSTIILDYERLGKPITAFILVSFLPNPEISQRQLGKEIAKLDGVHEVHVISGEWDLLLKVRSTSMEEVGKMVVDRLRQMKGVGRTVTCVCFGTIKEEQ